MLIDLSRVEGPQHGGDVLARRDGLGAEQLVQLTLLDAHGSG
jgi:hypothetical protein